MLVSRPFRYTASTEAVGSLRMFLSKTAKSALSPTASTAQPASLQSTGIRSFTAGSTALPPQVYHLGVSVTQGRIVADIGNFALVLYQHTVSEILLIQGDKICVCIYNHGLLPYCASASASAASAVRSASFKAARTVTVPDSRVMAFISSNWAVMVRAALGAQLPFSIKATVRFW